MKRLVLLTLIVFVMVTLGGLAWFVLRPASDVGREKGSEEAPAKPVPISVAAVIPLDRETQERVGLLVTHLFTTNAVPWIEGTARALDAAPLSQAWTDLVAARANRDLSHKELERLEALYQRDRNASDRALETGQAAVARDDALVAAAEGRLLAAWGPALVNRSDLPQIAERAIRMQATLTRIEIPLGSTPTFSQESSPSPAAAGPGEGSPRRRMEGDQDAHPVGSLPETAELAPLTDRSTRIPVQVIGLFPATDPLTQQTAYLALDPRHGFAAGTAFEAFVRAQASPRTGVFVPAPAVVRHDQGAFVYAAVDPEHFVRVETPLALKVGGGWLVERGLTNGQPVVVAGAQVLLSTEFKPADEEE